MAPNVIDIMAIVNMDAVSVLSGFTNSKLINKIKETFTEDEQKLFIAPYYCYLYCKPSEYVINFDDIWGWIDFSSKDHGMRLLTKYFIENEDYIVVDNLITGEERKEKRGGHNKINIIMTVNTFRAVCQLAGTNKAKLMRKYFTKLERLLFETITETDVEFSQRILSLTKAKDVEISKLKIEHKVVLKETIVNTKLKTLVKTYSGKLVLYAGSTEEDDSIDKFGISEDMADRWVAHVREIHDDWKPEFMIETPFAKQIEDKIKTCDELAPYRISKQYKKMINGKPSKHTELVSYAVIPQSGQYQGIRLTRTRFHQLIKRFSEQLDYKAIVLSMINTKNVQLQIDLPTRIVDLSEQLKEPEELEKLDIFSQLERLERDATKT